MVEYHIVVQTTKVLLANTAYLSVILTPEGGQNCVFFSDSIERLGKTTHSRRLLPEWRVIMSAAIFMFGVCKRALMFCLPRADIGAIFISGVDLPGKRLMRVSVMVRVTAPGHCPPPWAPLASCGTCGHRSRCRDVLVLLQLAFYCRGGALPTLA